MANPVIDTSSFTPTQMTAYNKAAALAPTPPTTISASSLSGTTTPAAIPTAPTPSNPAPTVAGGNAIIGANTATLTQAQLDAQNAAAGITQTTPAGSQGTPTAPASSSLSDLFKQYLGNLPKPASATDTYNTDYAAAGVDAKQTQANTDAAALKAAQAKLTGVNAQISGLTAEATAAKLAQENTFGTTGNTIGQQAQIDRNYAIKAIPFQVQALGAQAEVAAAQGNALLSQSILEQAQKHLDTVFQIHQTDSTNQYNYQKDLITSVYDFATKEQQAKLDDLKQQKQDDFTTQQNNLNYAQGLATTAITNGQAAVASKIMALDPKSATYAKDVATYAAQISAKNDIQYISATATQPGGTFNPRTGVFTPTGGAGGSQSIVVTDSAGAKTVIPKDTYSERQDTINLVNQALNDPHLSGAVGLSKVNPLNWIPGGANQNAKAILSQITAKLALDNRAKLKGSGAISDFESRTLQQAGSSFNTDLSFSDAKKQLTQIKGVLTTLNGNQAQVMVKDPKSGATQTAYADTAAINKMISDGLVVQYQ